MSLSKRITTIFISTIFICTTIVGTFSYMLERSEVIKANAERALAIARTVSTALESDQFSEIMNTLEPNEYYYDFKSILNGTIDKCDILYLYVVKVDGKEVTYFAEGFPRTDSPDEPEAVLGDTEDLDVYPNEMFESMNTGMEKMTGIYNLGGFGDMVSGYVPIKDDAGKVIGIIGVDLSIDDAMATANNFGFYMLLISLGLCTSSMIFIISFIKKYLGTPVREMTEAAGRLAVGDININIIKRNNDEIGQLTESFANIVNSTKEQSILIERLADGDFTVDISPRCTEDTINNSLTKLCDNLNDMMSNIQVSMYQVSEGSKQIEEGSHSVAHGSSEQAASIEELTVNISQLTESTRHNADSAKLAADLSSSVMKNAEIGNKKMEQMLIAVKDINEASSHIEKVIKVIDDIAFQTNILALNAAVEAARAGQHGKGFAVVAEEVRNLASKSAEAAKDTDGLIKDSIEKANLGASIAEETSASLKEIVAGITQNTQFITEIAQTGAEQENAVNEMHKGLSLVSEVIQKNSASAQESASASEEMSNQAHVLEDMVSQYKVKSS